MKLGRESSRFSFKLDRTETLPIKMEAPSQLSTAVEKYSIHPDKVEPLNNDLGQEATDRLKQLGYIS